MEFLRSFAQRLRGAPPAAAPARPAAATGPRSAPPSSFLASQMPANQDAAQQYAVRRDLLRLVMRDVLSRNGIPAAWLELQPLSAQSRDKSPALHARFVLKEWQPRVMEHVRGLEQVFVQRLMVLDPLASQWLQGLSWQLAVPDDGSIAPLPKAGSWTLPAASREEPAAALPAGDMGVIAAPVRIAPAPLDDRRAQLERMLAERDEAQAAAAGFEPTQPSALQ